MLVFEQMCQIKPQIGKPAVRRVTIADGPYWLKVSIRGDMSGEIYYSFPPHVALRIVSGMMGGMMLTELDDIGRSALAELGNMICGNASTILYGHGFSIDISPPAMVPPGGATLRNPRTRPRHPVRPPPKHRQPPPGHGPAGRGGGAPGDSGAAAPGGRRGSGAVHESGECKLTSKPRHPRGCRAPPVKRR